MLFWVSVCVCVFALYSCVCLACLWFEFGCVVPLYQRSTVVHACVACGRHQQYMASGEGGAMMMASGEEKGAVASSRLEQTGTRYVLLCSAVVEELQFAAVVGSGVVVCS